MRIQNDSPTSLNTNLTPTSKDQNAKEGGRYHNIQSIELTQCFRFVLLYLSFAIFFLLNPRSVYAETFNSNLSHKITTTSANYSKSKNDEQYHLTLKKNGCINTINTNISDEQQTYSNTVDGLYALKFSSDDDFTLSVANKGWNGTLEYSIDKGNTWSTWDGNQLPGTITQPIYLRGVNNTAICNGYDYKLLFTGKYCTGNIENLLDYQKVMQGIHPAMDDCCFYCLFYNCSTLEKGPMLSATTLADGCYESMFNCCENLKEAPELPATTLTQSCYRSMFGYCENLSKAPELPAIELAKNCYNNMFNGCINLTETPELPATILAQGCYAWMFAGCDNLIKIPELPATTLIKECYNSMFYACNSLKISAIQTDDYRYAYKIPSTDTGTTANNALTDMFKITNGTFKGTPDINTTYYTDHEPINASNSLYINKNLWVNKDSEITITAQPKENDTFYIEKDGYRYKKTYMFDKWSDGDTNTTKTLTINQANDLTALGKEGTPTNEQYLLTVNKDANVNSVTVKIGDNTIQPATTGGNTYWIDKGSNPTVEATAKSDYEITGGVGSIGILNTSKTVDVTSEFVALKFSSDDNFTLSVVDKGWNGTLQYSINNGNTWITWDGSQLPGTPSQPIYIRGTGNTKITDIYKSNSKWTFTGKYCTGNIETLLDYQTVVNGQHPTMTSNCYYYMFKNCTSLTTAPQLPATTLATYCYEGMFQGCTSLTTAPELPAITLADSCYSMMFYGCTSLTTAPQLPATTLAKECYRFMFFKCTSLTTLPKLSTTTLVESCYEEMFESCSSIKLSTTRTDEYKYEYRVPTSGTGTTGTNSLNYMFIGTGGTFTGTPTINTTYYTDHPPVG